MKKKLLALIMITGCTQKYVDFDLIQKVKFNKEETSSPTSIGQVISIGRDELNSCFNQWLFFSNADKEKEKAIPFMVRSLCPGQDYLVQTKMVETWWTTLIFTRSCIDIQTLCGKIKK
jgi:hypothetical protein